MFIYRKTQYCQDDNVPQLDLKIHYNPNQSPCKLFCEHRQINPKVYMERERTQNSQHNIEREEQS